jgi:hypothetical protein
VAQPTPASAQCAPRLSVSRTSGLAPGGEVVDVSGSCFDESKGIYVAFCVVPPPGRVPQPCGGGVDMSGSSGLSHWISSSPPPYGEGVAVPYGPGGSFNVTLRPSAALNASVDCRRVACAVVARTDHTRLEDRSQDVIVPVSFATDPVAPPPTEAPVFVPPPAVEAPAAEPETTTTLEPETTTSEAPATDTTVTTAADEATEVAIDATATDGGSGSGGVLVVLVVAVLVLVAAGGSGWLVSRRRRTTPGAS